MAHFNTASVDMFITLRSRLYRGQVLKEIKAVQASIERFGLLSPIVVTRQAEKLVIVDGRKRLAAIRRLDFAGRLPRSLVNIPYVELADVQNDAPRMPALMSNRELYETTLNMFRRSQDVASIAADLYLSHKDVRNVLTLACLSPRLRGAFFDRTINFHQARAFAAIANHIQQDRAFMSLGPFCGPEDIIDYIRKPKPAKVTTLRLAA